MGGSNEYLGSCYKFGESLGGEFWRGRTILNMSLGQFRRWLEAINWFWFNFGMRSTQTTHLFQSVGLLVVADYNIVAGRKGPLGSRCHSRCHNHPHGRDDNHPSPCGSHCQMKYPAVISPEHFPLTVSVFQYLLNLGFMGYV